MKPDRRKQLAAIHVIKKSLNMDDDTYRDALALQFNGVRSSADLTEPQLGAWLLHLKSLQKRAGLNTDGVRNQKMIEKCEALWIDLRKQGKVRDGSKEALQKFVQNKTSAAGLRTANGSQLYKVIEALKSWQAREIKTNNTNETH